MAYPFFYGIRKLARVEFVETRSIKDSNHKSDFTTLLLCFLSPLAICAIDSNALVRPILRQV